MKNKIFNKGVLTCALWTASLASLTSCTGNFEAMNTDPYGLNNADLPVSTGLKEAQLSVYYNQSNGNWEFQLIQNLNADLFSGYLAVPTPFAGNNNNSLYHMRDWNNWALNYYLLHVMKPTSVIIKTTTADDYWAVATALKVTGMLKATDLYGPMPYSKAMQGGLSVDYDSQEAIYKSFLSELEEAATRMGKFITENGDQPGRLDFDMMCGAKHTTWLHFINTLRMRVAMRMVNKEPALAKATCEAAVKSGVLTDSDINIEVKDPNTRNPLMVICRDYNDCNMSASMESILKGYSDPRIEKMFLPVCWGGKTPIVDKTGAIRTDLANSYHGIRQGVPFETKGEYTKFSIPKVKAKGDPNSDEYPLPIMRIAEAYFLRAEGSLRGWSMGADAKTLYEMGIKASFDYYGVDQAAYTAYINDEVKMAADYVDPIDPAHNIAAANLITVKYNSADSNEKNLQRIITQRWIASFPEGNEGWAMFRRTGYPKLFPVVENRSNGVIPEGEFVKRLAFTDDEKNSNAAGVASGIPLLGGADNIGTKLWWDTDGANF